MRIVKIVGWVSLAVCVISACTAMYLFTYPPVTNEQVIQEACPICPAFRYVTEEKADYIPAYTASGVGVVSFVASGIFLQITKKRRPKL